MSDSETIVIIQPIDLTRFCDIEDSRYALDTPWVHDGWRYATDGTICVRVPAGEEPDSPPVFSKERKQRKRPKAYKLFTEFPVCSECLDALGEPVPCDACQATGQELLECPFCGELSANPRGPVCRFCNGATTIPPDTLIGKRLLGGRYLSILADLPDLRICKEGPWDSALPFVSGELQGLLMPMKK